MMQLPIKKITTMGVLLAVSILLGYIEQLFSFFMVIPGAKLGLANLLVLLMIYSEEYKWHDILVFQMARILLCSILFANMLSFIYSLAGMLFSILSMYFSKEAFQLDIIATSMLGGVFHNVGQVVAAVCLISWYVILSHLPYLLILGLIAGFCMGLLSKLMWKRRLL